MTENPLKQEIKLGIFGGTFNPIHIGHLILAEDVREEFKLDRVVFIPTNLPPHKRLENGVSSSHRAEMVKIAIEDNPYFSIDYVEINRGGLSYTVNTAEYIYENYSFRGKPYFILGSDQAFTLKNWKDIDKLSTLFDFIVILRRGERGSIKDLKKYLNEAKINHEFFTKREVDVTSSEIRHRIKTGQSIRYLVTPAVYIYIKENKLYV